MKKKPIITTKSGFTLVEASLAIALLAILLLTITFLTSSIVSTYQRGLVTKSINSTGRDLLDDLQSAISSSPAADLSADLCTIYATSSSAYTNCKNNSAYYFIYNQRTMNIKVSGTTVNSAPISGAFCTGRYSYIWNTGYALNSNTYTKTDGSAIPRAKLKYKYNGAEVTTDSFRLLKVIDPSRAACSSHVTTSYTLNNSNNEYDITVNARGLANELSEAPIELLAANENALAIYDFRVFLPAQDDTTKRIFYSGTFILATIRGSININAVGDYCRVPDGINSDFDYCAINKFNFAMRATGGQTSE